MIKNKKILFLLAFLFLGLFSFFDVQAQMWDVAPLGTHGLPSGTIGGIVSGVVTWILGIFGFVGIIAFVISGILYLTAAGDPEQEKKAKKAMTMGIIGVIVGLMGLVIIFAVNAMLSAESGF